MNQSNFLESSAIWAGKFAAAYLEISRALAELHEMPLTKAAEIAQKHEVLLEDLIGKLNCRVDWKRSLLICP